MLTKDVKIALVFVFSKLFPPHFLHKERKSLFVHFSNCPSQGIIGSVAGNVREGGGEKKKLKIVFSLLKEM